MKILVPLPKSIPPRQFRSPYKNRQKNSYTRRLGKHKEAQNKPRPILITLPKSHDRSCVVSNRFKLAGSNIRMNFDLTKEQQAEEKRLRDIRNKLRQYPEFSDKKVTIYRNQIHVNRLPIYS